MTQNAASRRPFKVLLVEDNEDDIILIKHALGKLAAPIELQTAGEGSEALRMLRRVSPYEGAATPDLILLDLNMPGMDGRQLLTELKHDESLKTIPALVLSTSEAEHDVQDAYRLHASAYLTKPLYLSDFAHRTRCFVDFWFGEVALLPSARHEQGCV